MRELENALERACVVTSASELQTRDLPTHLTGTPVAHESTASDNGIVSIAELEKQTILQALLRLNGDKLLAARLLGIGKTTLYRKLKEYGPNSEL